MKSAYQGSVLNVWKVALNDLVAHRFLAVQLIRVSFLEEFKKSYLGITKAFLAPVLGVVIWLVFNQTGLFEPGETDIPYPAYVILSTGLFTVFLSFYEHCSHTLMHHKGLLTDAVFPLVVLFAQKFVHSIFHVFIPLVSTAIILVVLGVPLSGWGVLAPLALLPMMLAGAGLGYVMALAEVVALDVFTTMSRAIQALIFVTPVIYSERVESPFLQVVTSWNPLTYLLGAPRALILGNAYEHWDLYWVCTGAVALAFGLGLTLSLKRARAIIEKLY